MSDLEAKIESIKEHHRRVDGLLTISIPANPLVHEGREILLSLLSDAQRRLGEVTKLQGRYERLSRQAKSEMAQRKEVYDLKVQQKIIDDETIRNAKPQSKREALAHWALIDQREGNARRQRYANEVQAFRQYLEFARSTILEAKYDIRKGLDQLTENRKHALEEL